MKLVFGVFDWGLGHATRDTPLIEELLKRGHSVDIISTGRALDLIKKKFGNKCKYFDVPSVYVPYPKGNGFFALEFLKNVPKMLADLKKARSETERVVKKGGYDKVISDCRYDVYDKVDNSYLVNHQLRFMAPIIAENFLERWLALQTKHYKYVFVPDYPKNSLSENLSHNLKYVSKNKIKYIGILSHLKKIKTKQDIDYFISISGPEPQRTIFENRILSDIKKLKGRVVIALGKPESCHASSDKNVLICGFLDSARQQDFMNRAKFIISRPGYTTVMEMAELEKKQALFVPTPGQTEQEYLADVYENHKFFNHVSQKRLDLIRDVHNSRHFRGFPQQWKTKDSVKKFIKLVEN